MQRRRHAGGEAERECDEEREPEERGCDRQARPNLGRHRLAAEERAAEIAAQGSTGPVQVTLNQRLFQTEERRFDRIKKIADNLRLSYNVGETIMARLAQTHAAKEAVYDQSVVFFTTNDNVFTSLDSALTSQAGLHESTQAINAMTDGANKSLEVLAEVGTRVQEDALKAGHGVTIKAESVKKLIDAVVDYQQRSVQIVAQARREATDNAALIARLVDEGKARHEALIATPPTA